MRIQSTVLGDAVTVSCPFCNEATTIKLGARLPLYSKGQVTIDEENFPELNNFEREALISGMCFDCQEATFHKPKPGNEKAFGRYIGECECCGAPIWERDEIDGGYVCTQCGEEFEG